MIHVGEAAAKIWQVVTPGWLGLAGDPVADSRQRRMIDRLPADCIESTVYVNHLLQTCKTTFRPPVAHQHRAGGAISPRPCARGNRCLATIASTMGEKV